MLDVNREQRPSGFAVVVGYRWELIKTGKLSLQLRTRCSVVRLRYLVGRVPALAKRGSSVHGMEAELNRPMVELRQPTRSCGSQTPKRSDSVYYEEERNVSHVMSGFTTGTQPSQRPAGLQKKLRADSRPGMHPLFLLCLSCRQALSVADPRAKQLPASVYTVAIPTPTLPQWELADPIWATDMLLSSLCPSLPGLF